MAVTMTFTPFARTPERLDGGAAIGFATAELDAFANEVIAEVRPYPAERAGSRYRRTGDLGRAWRRTAVQPTGGALAVTVSNDVHEGPGPGKFGRPYADFVVGRGQRPLHRATGWVNFPEFWRRKSQNLDKRLQSAIMRGLVRR